MCERFRWQGMLLLPVALLLAACEPGSDVVGPDSQQDATLDRQQGDVPAILEAFPPSVLTSGSTEPLAPRLSAGGSSSTTVYSTIGDTPDWPASLGYQATATWESGDFVRATQPGVLNAVTVGMSSWACESGGWKSGDCSTSEGATFNHPITLNLYSVDYSGTDPAPGPVIASKTVSFDIPFRPSADPDACPDDPEKFYDDRLGVCANGLNTTITFEFTGDDVVVPSEFMYGVEFNTQSYGPNPIGTTGPYNSLNFGLFDKAANSVLVGEDVRDDDLLLEASGVPFDLYQFAPGAWPRTGTIQFDVTLAGHVTGGGWFTSPEGAYRPGTTSFGGLDWGFQQETGDDADASGALVAGPGTPPLGSGSANLAVSDGAAGIIWGAAHEALRFDRVTELGYSTYRSSPSTGVLAAALQFNVDYDLTDTDESWQGRLVFEPYLDGSTVASGTWQTWDALGGEWWATGSPGNGTCPQSDPCTWSEVLSAFPDAGVHPAVGAVLFKAGSGWAAFDGNVDAFRLGVDGTTTPFDFEPGSEPVGRASFGFVSRYKKGAEVPTGNTQFTFKAGDLNFHSTSYDWLVVNQGGSNAQFKGTGTINGQVSPAGDDYRFMVWAGDGDPDTFRIKIYYESGGAEHVVYDNGTDQPIEGGQIVVHDGKGKKK